MTSLAAPRGSLEELLETASPGEEARVFGTAYEVMGHLTATREALRRAVVDPEVRRNPVQDGHDHPARVPCVHCGLVSLELPPVTRGVLLTLLEDAGMSPEWNCIPTRRRSWVARKLEELPTDKDMVLSRLYGPRWFDVLWVALHLERLSPTDLARFSTRLPAAVRLPRERDPVPGCLSDRITAKLTRMDHRVGGHVRERLECHLYRVSQGSLSQD